MHRFQHKRHTSDRNSVSFESLSFCCSVRPALVCVIVAILVTFRFTLPGRSQTPSGSPLIGFKYTDLYEASIYELQEGLEARRFSSVDLVKAYLSRIEEVNQNGPALRAIIETNPHALAIATSLDIERKTNGRRTILHGIPVLIKDNIATDSSDGTNTTAGSYALLGSIVPADAHVVKRLRDAGAVILGKTNLSEFAEFKAFDLPPGWSAVGGQCTNAFYENADPRGSSSGSAVAISVGLATVALGTETDTSITCPSSNNNVVGIKPTLGLTSRSGVILTSEYQDSVGPMTRTVSDAAIILSVIAGKDPEDNFTLVQPAPVPRYAQALRVGALKGRRIGAPTLNAPNMTTVIDQQTADAFYQATRLIESLGATVIRDVELPFLKDTDIPKVLADQLLILEVDFKLHLNKYLASLQRNPSGVSSLADVIAFNDAHPDLEKPLGHESQAILEESEATTGRNLTYFETLRRNIEAGSQRGIDAALRKHKLDALIGPGLGWLTIPAALAGYPVITVPMGFYPDDTVPQMTPTGLVWPAPGVPMGVSFVGTAWSEFDLIGFAYDYEQKSQWRIKRRARSAAIPKTQLIDVIGAQPRVLN